MKIKRVFEISSVDEVEDTKSILRDIYADISDETHTHINKLLGSGNIPAYSNILSLINKERNLDMDLYEFYQSIVQNKLYMVSVRHNGNDLIKSKIKEAESRASYLNMDVIHYDSAPSSRSVIFLKDKEEVLQKLLSYDGFINESNSNDDITLEDIFDDVSDRFNVGVDISKYPWHLHHSLKLSVSKALSNKVKSISPDKFMEYSSLWENDIYEVIIKESTFSKELGSSIRESISRCSKHGWTYLFSDKVWNRDLMEYCNQYLFLKDVDVIVAKIRNRGTLNESNIDSDDTITVLEDIFADVDDEMRVRIELIDDKNMLGLLTGKIIGYDLFNKAFKKLDNYSKFIDECKPFLKGSVYEVNIRGHIDDVKIVGITQRCKRYGNLSLLYYLTDKHLGQSLYFAKNREELSQKLTSFINDSIIKESNSFDSTDESKHILEDIFADVLDDIEIKVTNLGSKYPVRLIYTRIIDSASLREIDELKLGTWGSSVAWENIYSHCNKFLDNNIYEVITSRYMPESDYKKIKARCEKYGNFFPIVACPWHKGQYKIVFLKNKEEIVQKILPFFNEN